MRCPECKGYVSAQNKFLETKCPSCGEKLRRLPTKEELKDFIVSFAEDRGYIFWSIIYFAGVWTIAFFEQILGNGILFDYIGRHQLRYLVMSAFFGSILACCIKANVEVTSVRNKFIFKPPRYLRAFRGWSNFALLLSLALASYIYYRWPELVYDPTPVYNYDINVARNRYMATNELHINSVLTLYTLLTAFLLCFIWAVMGLFLTEDDMNDKRIRYFMEEMRVRRVKYYHRAAAIYIGGFFLAGVTFYRLVTIDGLYFYIMNARFVYNMVTFFKTYFSWVGKFID